MSYGVVIETATKSIRRVITDVTDAQLSNPSWWAGPDETLVCFPGDGPQNLDELAELLK